MVSLQEGFTDLFGKINMSAIVDKIYFFLGIALLGIIVGVIIFGIFYTKSKKAKGKDLYKIGWWEEISNKAFPTRMDEAEEIVIPGTSLRVFYVKKRDLWLPRFTKGITKDLFYVMMTPNRRMINFTLKGLGDSLKEAGMEIDHTDMLWAAENTREFIKRNYKDKSIKWWQAYQGVITTALFILVMTFSFVIIIYMMRGIVTDISSVASTLSEALKTSCQSAMNSGVVAG